MKKQENNMPKLRLADLLRRRKSTLKKLLDDMGITTYERLADWCRRSMGVVPPTEEEFKECFPHQVSSPQEGVVVLEAPPVIAESSGRVIDVDNAPVEELSDDVLVLDADPSQKKLLRKKKSAVPASDG